MSTVLKHNWLYACKGIETWLSILLMKTYKEYSILMTVLHSLLFLESFLKYTHDTQNLLINILMVGMQIQYYTMY